VKGVIREGRQGGGGSLCLVVWVYLRRRMMLYEDADTEKASKLELGKF